MLRVSYKINEVARLTGLSYQSIYKRVQENEIHAVNVGRGSYWHYLIPRADLITWFKKIGLDPGLLSPLDSNDLPPPLPLRQSKPRIKEIRDPNRTAKKLSRRTTTDPPEHPPVLSIAAAERVLS